MVTEEQIDELIGRLDDICQHADRMINLLNRVKDKWTTEAGEEALTEEQQQRILIEYIKRRNTLKSKVNNLP